MLGHLMGRSRTEAVWREWSLGSTDLGAFLRFGHSRRTRTTPRRRFGSGVTKANQFRKINIFYVRS